MITIFSSLQFIMIKICHFSLMIRSHFQMCGVLPLDFRTSLEVLCLYSGWRDVVRWGITFPLCQVYSRLMLLLSFPLSKRCESDVCCFTELEVKEESSLLSFSQFSVSSRPHEKWSLRKYLVSSLLSLFPSPPLSHVTQAKRKSGRGSFVTHDHHPTAQKNRRQQQQFLFRLQVDSDFRVSGAAEDRTVQRMMSDSLMIMRRMIIIGKLTITAVINSSPPLFFGCCLMLTRLELMMMFYDHNDLGWGTHTRFSASHRMIKRYIMRRGEETRI